MESTTAIPASKHATLLIGNDTAEEAVLTIYTISGKIAKKHTVSLATGTNAIAWDIEDLSAGEYIVSLKGTNTFMVLK